jgi:hypothetical protein
MEENQSLSKRGSVQLTHFNSKAFTGASRDSLSLTRADSQPTEPKGPHDGETNALSQPEPSHANTRLVDASPAKDDPPSDLQAAQQASQASQASQPTLPENETARSNQEETQQLTLKPPELVHPSPSVQPVPQVEPDAPKPNQLPEATEVAAVHAGPEEVANVQSAMSANGEADEARLSASISGEAREAEGAKELRQRHSLEKVARTKSNSRGSLVTTNGDKIGDRESSQKKLRTSKSKRRLQDKDDVAAKEKERKDKREREKPKDGARVAESEEIGSEKEEKKAKEAQTENKDSSKEKETRKVKSPRDKPKTVKPVPVLPTKPPKHSVTPSNSPPSELSTSPSLSPSTSHASVRSDDKEKVPKKLPTPLAHPPIQATQSLPESLSLSLSSLALSEPMKPSRSKEDLPSGQSPSIYLHKPRLRTASQGASDLEKSDDATALTGSTTYKLAQSTPSSRPGRNPTPKPGHQHARTMGRSVSHLASVTVTETERKEAKDDAVPSHSAIASTGSKERLSRGARSKSDRHLKQAIATPAPVLFTPTQDKTSDPLR